MGGRRVKVDMVSIHAPTGGATVKSSRPSGSEKCFNPRAHGGRD